MGRARAAVVGAIVAGLLGAAPAPADESYREGVRRWREKREASLRAPGGWLSVAGLFWLAEGESRFGSDPSGDVVLPPSAPAVAGTFTFEKGRVTVRLAPGIEATLNGRPLAGTADLRPDTSGQRDALTMGPLSLSVIERSGRYGLRLRDEERKERVAFKGLSWFEVDERWRVEARYSAHPAPKAVKVPNVLGQSNEMPSPGFAEFEVDGKTMRLDGVLESPDASELFFIFRDETSGKETYGAGRFLYAEKPTGGTIVLDFNRAYSPPCAFTPYATCPLPPPQNRMPVRVEAGEKTSGEPH
jgi:hypothetical protein